MRSIDLPPEARDDPRGAKLGALRWQQRVVAVACGRPDLGAVAAWRERHESLPLPAESTKRGVGQAGPQRGAPLQRHDPLACHAQLRGDGAGPAHRGAVRRPPGHADVATQARARRAAHTLSGDGAAAARAGGSGPGHAFEGGRASLTLAPAPALPLTFTLTLALTLSPSPSLSLSLSLTLEG